MAAIARRRWRRRWEVGERVHVVSSMMDTTKHAIGLATVLRSYKHSVRVRMDDGSEQTIHKVYLHPCEV